MSGEAIVLWVAVGALTVAVLVGLPAYLTAHRLDRLHIRTDLARAALLGVLDRRRSVAAAVVRDLERVRPGSGTDLAGALAAARAHPPEAVLVADPAPDPDRDRWTDAEEPRAEHAENALGTALAAVDTTVLDSEVAAELEDVVDRLAMARRFHNDAVRDTRALRERTHVRVLRLAGRAPMPDYVELVDADAPAATTGPDGGGPGGRPGGGGPAPV